MLALLLTALASAADCASPRVEVDSTMEARFGPTLVAQLSRNLAAAYAQACAERLVDASHSLGAAHGRIRLRNAPHANVPSFTSSNGRTVLEYPFVSAGRASVPSRSELHEAIFCAVRGASADEQEESGRCLPD